MRRTLFSRFMLSANLRGGVVCMTILLAGSAARAQQVALPAVNLGDTSFLDGVVLPGWCLEIIGQAVHDGKTSDSAGNISSTATDVNSGAVLLHIAWVGHKKVLGGWYGAETVLSTAYVDTGGHGVGHGFGDVTFGPVLQWPVQKVFGMPLYQRVVLDIDAPLGRYTTAAAVNVGNHAWDVHPYYAVTLLPTKRIETSWRLSYLWDGANNAPPKSMNAQSTQAGQAFHFNATAGYQLVKGLYLGANGYYLKQLTDARMNGQSLPNSKEEIGAIGPGGVFHRNKWFFFVNGYHELGARNLASGSKLVLRVEKVW